MFQPGGGYVEGIRGRSGGAGVDHAVYRNDRDLGAIDPPALKGGPGRDLGAGFVLGKSGTAGRICAFRVDSSGRRHHH